MTYDRLRLEDEQLLDVLAAARRLGALTMIHAENHGMIAWLSARLVHAGATAPRYHAIAHPRVAEGEAVQRAIALAELVDVPILIVHVSDAAGASAIRQAQTRGLRVYGETCPQYLFLTADDLDRPGLEGAKYGCSPPPRDRAAQDGDLGRPRQRHLPGLLLRPRALPLRRVGQAPEGRRARPSRTWPTGCPASSSGSRCSSPRASGRGRLSLGEFVALGATNHAKLYGLYPRKGTIAVGGGRGPRPLGPRTARPRHRHDAPRPGRATRPTRGASSPGGRSRCSRGAASSSRTAGSTPSAGPGSSCRAHRPSGRVRAECRCPSSSASASSVRSWSCRRALSRADAAADLGQHLPPEELQAGENVTLRHPGPADAHRGVGHPGPMLSEERVDDLGR